MRATRRLWAVAAVGVALALWAVVLQRTLPLAGAVGVAAWLLARQYRFLSTCSAAVDAMTVDVRPGAERVAVGETVSVAASVDLGEPIDAALTVATTAPVSAEGDPATLSVPAGGRTDEAVADLRFPVAGTAAFDRPTATFRDPLGLFVQSVPVGPAPTVAVEPPSATVHVGEGGEAVAAGFGEHTVGRTGSGTEPLEIRQYVPGDTVSRIDWKATARLDEAHVREAEAETELRTAIVLDHRASTATGAAGGTAFEFGRGVATAVADAAERLSDPLGCYTVGDEGLTGVFDPAGGGEHYRTVRRHLLALEPTATPVDRRSDASPDPDTETGAGDPARARRVAAALSGDSPFDRRLRPFFDRPTAHVRRIADRPLFAAVRRLTARLDGPVRTVLITDDRRRTELLEAAKLAGRGDGDALVFVAPAVLYDRTAARDAEAAYADYAEFESFRRRLAALPGVSAFEVGPRDELRAILATGRRERERGAGV